MSESVKTNEPKKATEQELKNKIYTLEAAHKASLELTRQNTFRAANKVVGQATGIVRENHRAKDEILGKAKSTASIVKGNAYKAREAAIGKAQGDYIKAVSSADETYREIFDRLEKETLEKNAPIEAEMKKAEAQIIAQGDTTLSMLKDEFRIAVDPLRKELQENFKKVKAAVAEKSPPRAAMPTG